MAVGAAFVLVLLIAIALPVGLWLLIERETADEEVLERSAAEQRVRDDDRERRSQEWDR